MSCNHDWFDHYMMYSAFNAGKTSGSGGCDSDGCLTAILFIVFFIIGLFTLCVASFYIERLFDFLSDAIRQISSLFI